MFCQKNKLNTTLKWYKEYNDIYVYTKDKRLCFFITILRGFVYFTCKKNRVFLFKLIFLLNYSFSFFDKYYTILFGQREILNVKKRGILAFYILNRKGTTPIRKRWQWIKRDAWKSHFDQNKRKMDKRIENCIQSAWLFLLMARWWERVPLKKKVMRGNAMI